MASVLFVAHVGAFSLAALGCFASLPRLRRVSDRDTRRGLLALVGMSGAWASTVAGYLVLPSPRLKVGVYLVGLVVGFATVGAWLYFCSAYTGRGYHRNVTYRRLAVVVFLAITALKVSNPLHQAYFTTAVLATPFPHLAVRAGPLHWTAMGLAYALAFVGFFLLFELFDAVDFDTRPLAGLAALTGLPVLLDLASVASPRLVELTYEPIGVAAFALGVAYVHLDRFEAVQLAAERDTPIVALDAEGRIRDTNRAARELFPALAGAGGQPLGAVLPEVADRLGADEPILEVARADGTRYLRVTESPFSTAKAGIGRTVVLSDVTERERYREELERQNRRLETFASMVSHDLRNPLNVAKGRLDLAMDADGADREALETVRRALRRMDELIEDVLVLARHGQPVEEPATVRLSAVAEESWAMVETGDATLSVDSDLAFLADPERVKRLFENLIRNAIDHAGTDATVLVGALEGPPGFYVEDDGPGIPASDRERVFEAGYSTRSAGTGFGLAIVGDVASAHGWDVRVTEGEAGGARFEVTGVEPVDR